MDRPRLGIPESPIRFSENIEDLERLQARFLKGGYHKKIPEDINPHLRQWIHYFRANLDVYDHIVDKKVFSRDELYFRCISEGPAFTEYIKKCRSYSLQAKISLIELELNYNYVHSEYSGYDSIIHERYLIYWDDRLETIDWPYSLLTPKEVNEDQLAMDLQLYMAEHSITIEKPTVIPFIEKISGKKSSLMSKGRTTLLKDTWYPEINQGNYFATRKVVPTEPGSTRDTGVPDVDSLCRIKLIHNVCRQFGEQSPNSANCPFNTFNKRLRRIRKKRVFLHVDFKKFGLTCPRSILNTVLRGLECPELQINSFYLETEEGVIRTQRGSVLGWLDPLGAIAVSIILWRLNKDINKKFDFIIFNDDIEISTDIEKASDLELLRSTIINRLESYDLVVSHRKCYASKMSIFLEEYTQQERYSDPLLTQLLDLGIDLGRSTTERVERSVNDFIPIEGLDMRKLQMAVKPYGQALTSPYSWETKACYARGHRYFMSPYLQHICMNTIDPMYPEEYSDPVELGGWTFKFDKGLNIGLIDAEAYQLRFFQRMRRYKEPHLMPKMTTISIQTLETRKNICTLESRNGSIEQYKNLIKLDKKVEITEEHIGALRLIDDPGGGTRESRSSDLSEESTCSYGQFD